MISLSCLALFGPQHRCHPTDYLSNPFFILGSLLHSVCRCSHSRCPVFDVIGLDVVSQQSPRCWAPRSFRLLRNPCFELASWILWYQHVSIWRVYLLFMMIIRFAATLKGYYYTALPLVKCCASMQRSMRVAVPTKEGMRGPNAAELSPDLLTWNSLQRIISSDAYTLYGTIPIYR